MKCLLTALNAKYIHSNLAVYSLQAYAAVRGYRVEIAEFTVNQRIGEILERIYRRKPDLLVFSCYIWNIDMVTELAEEFHKLCPQVPVWAGGPEVSYETEAFLRKNPAFTGVMMGEGERTFSALCAMYEASEAGTGGDPVLEQERLLAEIPGISWRRADGTVAVQPLQELLPMDELPFCYEKIEDFQNRIIYYESSRGCPFCCSYCLSSVDKALRFRSRKLVFRELQFFLDHQVSQVKFVDRTFNCRPDHALAVWNYLQEHDNGVTNFHFEVAADLLTGEEMDLFSRMRPGLIQLEIGVQSTNDRTIREIRRRMDLKKVCHAVLRVRQGKNIHQHLDLIAGLPFEDYQTFQRSFDTVYGWKPDQLQLGFLKVLKGSYMYGHADDYGIVCRSRAPYEVMATRWISYGELLEIHLVEQMLEQMYNSGQFRTAMSVLEKAYGSPFQMFLDMAHFFREKGWLESSHSRIQWTEMFLEFAAAKDAGREIWYQEALVFDLYRIEKSKSRPLWAASLREYRKQTQGYLRRKGMEKSYCHLEPFWFLRIGTDGKPEFAEIPGTGKETRKTGVGQLWDTAPVWILFDYGRRDPLTNEAALTVICPENMANEKSGDCEQ